MNELNYGQAIKKERLMRGLSLNKAAKQIGVSHGSLFAWENNINSPSEKNIKKINEFYKTDKAITANAEPVYINEHNIEFNQYSFLR